MCSLFTHFQHNHVQKVEELFRNWTLEKTLSHSAVTEELLAVEGAKPDFFFFQVSPTHFSNHGDL